MANTVKVTKRDMFNTIIAECASNAAIVEFCQHEIELLDKKSAKGSGKLSKTQAENVELKGTILKVLREYGGEGRTISDLIKENADVLGGYTNQKLSALMRQLIAEGLVEKVVDKKKSYFCAVMVSTTEFPPVEFEGDPLEENESENENEDVDNNAPETF